jgi:uncharacterized phage protein gp47/JayE
MPYQRPPLSDLITQAEADVIATAGNLLPIDILTLLAIDQAGLANLHFGHIDRVSLECTPWSAINNLEAWAALRKVLQIPAKAAALLASFTGPNGTPITAGATVTRQDGEAYTITTGGTIASGTVSVTITDNAPGAQGNCTVGTPLTLGSAPLGVNAAGVAGTSVIVGADAETSDSLRTRMLQIYAAPPQGGSRSDYVEWALAVPGVTRAWITPLGNGAGTVIVYTMFDIAEAAFAGIPQGTNGVATLETRDTAATGDQLAVANSIFPLRPVTALVYSNAPVAYPVAFRITDVLPNTADMQAAITASLAAAFVRSASPGGTTWPVTVPGAANGTMYMNIFTAALDAVPGLQRYTLVTPNSPITAPTGDLPTLGAITWT